MLAVLRRPFEAHVFKHGYRDPLNPYPTPIPSRRPSPSRISIASEKFRGRISASTYRSNTSTPRLDIDTQNQTPNSPPTTIHAPSPIRAIGLGIFTSQEQPPPLPAAYNPSRTSSTETPPFVQPTAPLPSLAPPPRMSSLVSPSGFVPLSIPAQFSASAWRAIHPPLKSPLGGREGNKSQPHLPSGPGFSYRNRYSRSSVSLTKPHRISSATPAASVAWSSRSGSTGPGEEGRGSPSSGSITAQDRATASAIAYAILNGTPIPGTEAPRTRTQHKSGHVRRASAPDPRTIAGAAHSEQPQERMAKGWKPQLQDPVPIAGPSNSGTATTNNVKTPTPTPSLSRPHIPRSSSAELLSKFSPDSSPDDNTVNLRRELERQLDDRFASVRKSRSESPLRQMRHSDVPVAAKRMSRMPQDPRIAKRNSDVRMEVGMAMLERERERKGKGKERGRWEFEEVKNKPLPKIAAL